MDWKGYFIELLIVTSGILIAFVLNSWNETRQEERLAALYLEGIFEELKVNKTELEITLDYHQSLLKSLIENPLEVNMVLQPPSISKSAWNLSENDIFKRYVDAKLYQIISQAYQIHESLNTHSQESSSMMSELNVLGPIYMSSIGTSKFSEEEKVTFDESIRQGWIPIFQDWVYYETIYIKKIDEVLAYPN